MFDTPDALLSYINKLWPIALNYAKRLSLLSVSVLVARMSFTNMKAMVYPDVGGDTDCRLFYLQYTKPFFKKKNPLAHHNLIVAVLNFVLVNLCDIDNVRIEDSATESTVSESINALFAIKQNYTDFIPFVYYVPRANYRTEFYTSTIDKLPNRLNMIDPIATLNETCSIIVSVSIEPQQQTKISHQARIRSFLNRVIVDQSVFIVDPRTPNGTISLSYTIIELGKALLVISALYNGHMISKKITPHTMSKIEKSGYNEHELDTLFDFPRSIYALIVPDIVLYLYENQFYVSIYGRFLYNVRTEQFFGSQLPDFFNDKIIYSMKSSEMVAQLIDRQYSTINTLESFVATCLTSFVRLDSDELGATVVQARMDQYDKYIHSTENNDNYLTQLRNHASSIESIYAMIHSSPNLLFVPNRIHREFKMLNRARIIYDYLQQNPQVPLESDNVPEPVQLEETGFDDDDDYNVPLSIEQYLIRLGEEFTVCSGPYVIHSSVIKYVIENYNNLTAICNKEWMPIKYVCMVASYILWSVGLTMPFKTYMSFYNRILDPKTKIPDITHYINDTSTSNDFEKFRPLRVILHPATKFNYAFLYFAHYLSSNQTFTIEKGSSVNEDSRPVWNQIRELLSPRATKINITKRVDFFRKFFEFLAINKNRAGQYINIRSGSFFAYSNNLCSTLINSSYLPLLDEKKYDRTPGMSESLRVLSTPLGSLFQFSIYAITEIKIGTVLGKLSGIYVYYSAVGQDPAFRKTLTHVYRRTPFDTSSSIQSMYVKNDPKKNYWQLEMTAISNEFRYLRRSTDPDSVNVKLLPLETNTFNVVAIKDIKVGQELVVLDNKDIFIDNTDKLENVPPVQPVPFTSYDYSEDELHRVCNKLIEHQKLISRQVNLWNPIKETITNWGTPPLPSFDAIASTSTSTS